MHALWRFIKGSGVALFETPFLGFYEEVPLLRRWNYPLEFHEKALFLRQGITLSSFMKSLLCWVAGITNFAVLVVNVDKLKNDI